MAILTWNRWTGLASMLGGVLMALFYFLSPARDPAGAADTPHVAINLLGIAAIALTQFGLVGLYARQREQVATLGLIGFAVAFIGLVMTANELFYDTVVLPVLTADAPDVLAESLQVGSVDLLFRLTSGVFVAGFVLFGAATLQAGVLPRWGSLLVAIGSFFVIGRLPSAVKAVGVLAFGVGLVWLGFALWSETAERAE